MTAIQEVTIVECQSRLASAIENLPVKLNRLLDMLLIDPRVRSANVGTDSVDTFYIALTVEHGTESEITEIVREALDDADLTEADFTVAR